MFADRFPTRWAQLRADYDAMGHAYHNWAHIEALLEMFTELHGAFVDSDAVEIAILYHDVIYVPGAADNEARSAEHMTRSLRGEIADATLHRADAMIRATATHKVPASLEGAAMDCASLLDMDLSILGAERDIFVRYDAAIRSEFAHIPDDIYRPARRSVMQQFLERDYLYLTPRFWASHEEQARANLRQLLEDLA